MQRSILFCGGLSPVAIDLRGVLQIGGTTCVCSYNNAVNCELITQCSAELQLLVTNW